MTTSLQSQPAQGSDARKSVVRQPGFWAAVVAWYLVAAAIQTGLRSALVAEGAVPFLCLFAPFLIPALSIIAVTLMFRQQRLEAAWGVISAYASNIVLALISMGLPNASGVFGKVLTFVMSLFGWPIWLTVLFGSQ